MPHVFDQSKADAFRTRLDKGEFFLRDELEQPPQKIPDMPAILNYRVFDLSEADYLRVPEVKARYAANLAACKVAYFDWVENLYQPMLDAFKAEATEAVGLAGHPKEDFVWKVIRQYIPPDTSHRAEDDWYMNTDEVFDFLEDLAKAILPIAEP